MNRYSEKFVKECKSLYPNFDSLHKALDENNYFVGKYLDYNSYGVGVTTREILDSNSLEDLKSKALLQQRKKDAYEMWHEEVKGWKR